MKSLQSQAPTPQLLDAITVQSLIAQSSVMRQLLHAVSHRRRHWHEGAGLLCRPFVQTWAQQHLPDGVSEGSRAYLLALFEEHVDAGLAWVRCHGSEYVPSVDIALVTSLTSLVQVHLPDQLHAACLLTSCVSGLNQYPFTSNREPCIS